MTTEAVAVPAAVKWRAGATEALAERIAAERDRLLLWLPVFFAAGIGVYFGLPYEPPRWLAPAATLAAMAMAIVGRRRGGWLMIGLAAIAAGLGFAAAQWRTYSVAAPVIERRLGPIDVEGRVAAVEIRAEGRRIVLHRLQIAGRSPERTPAQIRLTARRDVGELRPGDRVAVRAVLLPPPPPAAPGAYDFQRQAWFDRLGAVGFAVGEWRKIGREEGWSWLPDLQSARQAVVERTLAALPGPEGAIAAALLTGEQGAIPPQALEAMRDSGLAHLLSISGLHIGLVAAIVFFAVRGSFALIPFVALRWPIKKWAAVAAFAAITFYMLFASPGVPTQRAWLMTSVVLLAIVIDRTAISMRLVAWAAFAVLLFKPESLLGPSFQMSFAAVVALIAAWEVTRSGFTQWRSGGGWPRRASVALAAVCLTTLVAGMASSPYALYHFNRFAAYGLAANLIAVPLTSLWVMPWAVLAFPLFLIGAEQFALAPMGWGVDAIVLVAETVASWGGAVALVPAMPVWGLIAVSLGGVWLCLWQTRWRLAGVPVIALGLLSIATERGPDILVSGDARLLAVRGTDGALHISTPRAGRLTRETWLRRAGQEAATLWPAQGASVDGRLTCDAAGCLYRAHGQVVALVRHLSALAEDCRIAGAVVATVPVRRACPSAQLVIDRFALWRDGGHAIWLSSGGVRFESVRGHRGDRLWVAPVPEPRRGQGRS